MPNLPEDRLAELLEKKHEADYAKPRQKRSGMSEK